jgi:hypothetical protein
MRSKFVGILLFLVLLTPGSLLAQGLFQAVGLPATVTSTGQTEVIGPIIVSMTQGPAGAGTLVIDVSPLQITNATAADISVAPTGLTVGATTIDTTNNLVQIPVNASTSSNASIRIQGIRVAVAGTNINSLNAKLSWLNSGNVFTSGASVPVISSVQSGLVAQPITDPFVIFNGQVYRNTSTIHVAEGYAGAFSNSAQFGQTGSTQVRIRVTDFPNGIQMVFPATITANESSATLTAVGGAPVTLTGAAGFNTVSYNYSKAANSDSLTESFDIKFSVNVVGPVDILQPTIEVSLTPIGAAVPNATFPATDIPRYAEDEILVQAGSSRIITKVLYWTGVSSSMQNQIHMTNPSSRVANLTIDAFDTAGQAVSGTGVTNPVKLALPANQSLVRSVSDLFGTAAGIASIRVQSTSPDLLAVAVVTGNGVNESVPFVSRTIASAFFPVVNEGAQLQLMNPNSAAVTGKLTLLSADGKVVSATPVSLGPLASTSIAVQTAFGSANPQSGYASAVFSNQVAAFESFGTGNALNLTAIQPTASEASLFIPFIAGGSSFQTDVNLINLSDQIVALQAELFTGNGTQVGSTQLITMLPGDQLVSSIQQIFSQSPDTGYVRIDLPQLYKGFFSYYPAIAGMARVRSLAGGSTVIPLSAYPLADSFVLGDGTSAGGFEGIAFVNPTGSNVAVTLQALNLDGSLAAAASVTLSGGQVVSQLTNQLFNGGLPAQTVIRVTSSAPIAVTAISGTTALDQIRSLPVLR